MKNIFPQYVGFQIHRVAGLSVRQGSFRQSVGDDGYGKRRISRFRANLRHGKADAVDGDGSLLDDACCDSVPGCDIEPDCIAFPPPAPDGSDAVDMAGDNVSSEASVRRHGPLQIHPASRGEAVEGGSTEGLRHHIGGEMIVLQIRYREADAVNGDAVPRLRGPCEGIRRVRYPAQNSVGPDAELCEFAAPPDLIHNPDFFDYSCKHELPPVLGYPSRKRSSPIRSVRMPVSRRASGGDGNPAPSTGDRASAPPKSRGPM